MNFDNFTNVTNTQERDLEMSRVFPSLMRKVYIWMTMALAITGVVAYGAGNSPALIQFLYMGRGAMIVMALVEFGIVWYLSSRIDKLSLTAATIWFIIFAYCQWTHIRMDFRSLLISGHHEDIPCNSRNLRSNGVDRFYY